MPEDQPAGKTEGQAVDTPRRSKRIYVMWGVALALLCVSCRTKRDAERIALRRVASEALKRRLDEAGVSCREFRIDEDGYCHLDFSGKWDSRKRAPIKSSFSRLDLLENAPIKTLELCYTDVKDLSPLRGMPLAKLDLHDTPVQDLGPLRGIRLEWLRLYFTKVTDLSPLEGMPLKVLYIPDAVTDLTPLKAMPLVEVGFHPPADSPVNLEVLRGIETLKEITGDPVSEFFERWRIKKAGLDDLVSRNSDGSYSLSAFGTIDVLPDLSAVGVLRSIHIAGCRKLTDLSPVAGLMPDSVHLWKTGVEDISPLVGMPLKKLVLFGSPVSDLSPLAGMPLESLDIGATRVTDLSPLKGMKLERLQFRPTTITKGMDALREMKTLKAINLKPTALFWMENDHGEWTAPHDKAWALYEKDECARALPFATEALRVAEKARPADPYYLTVSFKALAFIYEGMGKYEKAQPLYVRCLAYQERALGKEHADVATTLNYLGEISRKMRHYDKAERFYKRSLALREKILGKSHADVAACLNNLAELYHGQRKTDKRVENLYRRSLAIMEKTPGKNDSDLAITLGVPPWNWSRSRVTL